MTLPTSPGDLESRKTRPQHRAQTHTRPFLPAACPATHSLAGRLQEAAGLEQEPAFLLVWSVCRLPTQGGSVCDLPQWCDPPAVATTGKLTGTVSPRCQPLGTEHTVTTFQQAAAAGGRHHGQSSLTKRQARRRDSRGFRSDAATSAHISCVQRSQ